MNVNIASPQLASAQFALALAATLETSEEVVLGPSDQALCASALKAYAEQLDAALA